MALETVEQSREGVMARFFTHDSNVSDPRPVRRVYPAPASRHERAPRVVVAEVAARRQQLSGKSSEACSGSRPREGGGSGTDPAPETAAHPAQFRRRFGPGPVTAAGTTGPPTTIVTALEDGGWWSSRSS